MLSGKIKNASGFTLIEIAVVLVIVGILVGSFIGSFADRIDTTRRDNTKKELDEIKSVLMAFAFSQTFPHLPCPDTDVPPDGDENRLVSGACAAATGFLPWNTVGGAGYADAWDNRYHYRVNVDYANNAGFVLTTNDNNSATVDTSVGNNNISLLSNAVAVIYSKGKNGLGGISSSNINRPALPAVGNGYDDENENADGDDVFMSRSMTKEGAAITGGIFDDIVIWINSYELKAKMVEAGKLP